jgi:uncharacterized membrane protein
MSLSVTTHRLRTRFIPYGLSILLFRKTNPLKLFLQILKIIIWLMVQTVNDDKPVLIDFANFILTG